MACAAATFVGCGNSTPKADLKTDVDTMSYAMGMSQTQGLKEFMVERMGVDTAYMDDFIKGLNDGANAGDDLNSRPVKVDINAIGGLFFRVADRALRRVGFNTEIIQRHAGRNQVVNRQVKGDNGCQVARLVKGGAQGKIVAILPGEAAQRGKGFPLVQGVCLQQHFCATGFNHAGNR